MKLYKSYKNNNGQRENKWCNMTIYGACVCWEDFART